MFKRILTSAALVLGLAVPTATGIALVAPEVAHATTYTCGTTINFDNEDASKSVLDSHVLSSADYVMAYDGSENGDENYPIYVGTQPTGIYANYGLWNICWTTTGGGPGTYHGYVALENVATNRVWGVETGGMCGSSSCGDPRYTGMDFANYATNAEGAYVYNFQCTGASGTMKLTNQLSGSNQTSFNPNGPGGDTEFSNSEWDNNEGMSLSADTFFEEGLGIRWAC